MAEDSSSISSSISRVSTDSGGIGQPNPFNIANDIGARNSALTEAQRSYQESLARTSSTQNNQRGLNPLGAAGRQAEYDFTYRAFPGDLGQGYQGHYMVININVPVRSTTAAGITSGASGQFTSNFNVTNELSRVDRLRGITAATQGQSALPNSFVPRFTRRIKESIALYMPNTLNFNTHNVYEDISLTALAGNLGVGILGLGATARAARDAQLRRQGNAAASLFSGVGQVIGRAASLMQSPINPAIEVLFANTLQRQFVFEVLMAPRNERESENIKEIVKTLRFHAAPEINNYSAGGALINAAASFLWIPPAEFDITFFKDGVENTHIPRINTCALERIEADFSPTGIYSTFSNGHPVAVRLSLGFRELEPVHKARVLEGF